MVVETKSDLEPRPSDGRESNRISTLSGEGMAAFVDRLSDFVKARVGLGEAAVIVRERQIQAVEESIRFLNDALRQPTGALELVSADLRGAAMALARLTGRPGSGPAQRLSVHAFLVLRTSGLLLLGGAVLFFFFEYDNALAQLPLGGKLLAALFQSVTPRTAGFNTLDYGAMNNLTLLATIILMFIGGCAGSTAGGLKVVRCLLLVKQGRREIVRLVHPAAEIPVQLGGRAVPLRVVDAVWGFFAVYVGVFTVLMMALMVTGVDQVTAFSAIAATLNNLGPGLGEVAYSYQALSGAGKWICVLAMLLGRLEIFTLLLLFTVTFWRK